MSRRIEIELTSARPDGSWTWRVAGAKQPKGVIEAGLVPDGVKVGDVLRADAEVELEGTTITTILGAPPKRQTPDLLEIIGDQKPFEAVTTNLAPKGSRPKRDWAEVRPRSDRGPAGGGRGGPGARPGAPGSRPGASGGRPDRAATRPERAGQTGDRPGRPDSGRSDSGRPDSGRPRGTGRSTDSGSTGENGRPADRRQGGRERTGSPNRPGSGDARRREPTGPRVKRLNPASVHRDAVLASLAPEERAVAEQVLQGGVPAVRRAVQDRNALAREEGRPEVKADALLALAEELLPRLKSAEWRDRAEAAAKDIDDVSVRDLRSIVAGADAAARDDESRILAKSLRDALERREEAERDAWIKEVTTCLDDGKVTRALRVAGRPPDPRTRFPAEMTSRLSDAASTAMAPDTSPERWSALLAAVLESPVRRSVKPAGLPSEPGEALLMAARQASGRIPALAAMLGLNMPPPPGPRPGMRPPKPAPRGGGAPRPPSPAAPAPDAPVAGSAIADQTPAAPAPASAEPGTPLDPATLPARAEPAHPGDAPDATHHGLEVPHSQAAPPTAGGGTDDQPTPQAAAAALPGAPAGEAPTPHADDDPRRSDETGGPEEAGGPA